MTAQSARNRLAQYQFQGEDVFKSAVSYTHLCGKLYTVVVFSADKTAPLAKTHVIAKPVTDVTGCGNPHPRPQGPLA